MGRKIEYTWKKIYQLYLIHNYRILVINQNAHFSEVHIIGDKQILTNWIEVKVCSQTVMEMSEKSIRERSGNPRVLKIWIVHFLNNKEEEKVWMEILKYFEQNKTGKYKISNWWDDVYFMVTFIALQASISTAKWSKATTAGRWGRVRG